MIALIQRASRASVTVDGALRAEIDSGLVVLLGIAQGDDKTDAAALARKTANLRVFEDSAGKMNLSLMDIGGEALVISQFTLCADTRKGNRPSFVKAAPPIEAIPLYESFLKDIRAHIGEQRVKTGEFGADMKVALVNDGPVTITLSTKDD